MEIVGWTDGLFLGVQDRSDEVVIGTRGGVFRARTVKRLDGCAEIRR